MSPFKHAVAVVGLGRVGLPLALKFVEAGVSCVGVDIDLELLKRIKARKMPFDEPGFDAILEQKGLCATSDFAALELCENIIVTVGTPLMQHIEVDMTAINSVVDAICSELKPGHNIILRSTVAPSTTAYVHRKIERATNLSIGVDIGLSFCPERIAEGKAYIELKELPQIVGHEDSFSLVKAESVFSVISSEILPVDTYVSAELAKVCCNAYRYIQFAISNEILYLSSAHGVNVFDVIKLMNHNYPRSQVHQPGLSAGTCLRKDWGMLSQHRPHADLFLSAWKVNEYMPSFLVNQLVGKTLLAEREVAVLGYGFKKDSDDSRDSLVPKLLRLIALCMPTTLYVCDPHFGTELKCIGDNCIYTNTPVEEFITKVDIVIIATPHSEFATSLPEYMSKAKDETLFVDIWNVGSVDRLLYTKKVLSELHFGEKVPPGIAEPPTEVLITGAAGFIGFGLAKFLHGIGFNLTLVDNLSRGEYDAEFREFVSQPRVKFLKMDLCEKVQIEGCFDVVYHLAAVNGTKNFYEKPEVVVKVNILSTINMIEWATPQNCGKFMFASSSEAYAGTLRTFQYAIPTPEEIPLCIDNVNNPRWSYGGSKLAGELLVINMCKAKGVPYIISRYHNVYGPRSGYDHVIPEFCTRLLQGVSPFPIYGGDETRSFMFIDDCSRCLYTLLHKTDVVNELFHIGDMKEEVSIKQLALRLASIAGYESLELQVKPAPAGCVNRRCPDISKLQKLTSWKPEIDLQEGLKRTFAWYATHFRNAKW
eukprot:CAMPEP_0118920896 /NCGR_PEP_ID=MMETSP1169-20130426/328_1 /TAXON_ID=36882 /ORGANISM="Pyramimonas obovata, Strain CCMP722" /LENGTH=762 /DNA_ID=CAMNT_0006861517 /DNA_START=182 /DNA_END=2467 /DNA_ORIENTATION=+